MEGAMKNCWFVRSLHGELIPFFIRNKCVALGFAPDTDFTGKNKQFIQHVLLQKYPEKESAISIWTSYFEKFISEMKKGDYVLTYDPESREYLLGTITSDYHHERIKQFFYNEQLWAHVRYVAWNEKRISRDSLSRTTKNSLGSTLSVFEVQAAQTEEIVGLFQKGEQTTIDSQIDEEERNADLEEVFEKLQDRIMQFSPEQMEELVKEVLIAMGYIAERTPVGPDRGIDVFASKDGLGLEDPRIFVEVKHREGKMGSSEIRKFLGGRKSHDKCVFVSTGGFTQEAKYEAERSAIPLTLVDIQKLSSIIERYYDNFSVSGKILLPLKKVYLPL